MINKKKMVGLLVNSNCRWGVDNKEILSMESGSYLFQRFPYRVHFFLRVSALPLLHVLFSFYGLFLALILEKYKLCMAWDVNFSNMSCFLVLPLSFYSMLLRSLKAQVTHGPSRQDGVCRCLTCYKPLWTHSYELPAALTLEKYKLCMGMRQIPAPRDQQEKVLRRQSS